MSATDRSNSHRLVGLKRVWLRVYRRARLDLWFPHVPLAIAVGAAGALALLPAVSRYLHEYLHLQLRGLNNALHPLSSGVPQLILAGVPTAVIGALQVFVAIGLLLRSRLGWVAAVVITLVQLVLAIGYTHQAWYSAPVIYIAVLLAAIILSRHAFTRSSLAAGTLFGLAATVLLLAYGVIGSLILGQGFAPPINDIPEAVYFTVVTMSTVGYGDIDPKTDDARLFVISLILIGITVFLTSITAVIGPLLQGRLTQIIDPNRRRKMKRVNHFVIAGQGALARNTVRELLNRDRSVVVIADDEDLRFWEAEMVVGDATDLDVLRKAGVETAQAILALSDDDAENAFVILAVRELNTEAKKIASVSARKNLERVRRVQPDMIMAPNVFGSEILAMALTEEKIDGESLLDRFLDVKPHSGAA